MQKEDPFLKILPIIDVHGETSDTVTLVVKDIIEYNRKLNKNKIAVIHGRHSKILKNAIHEYLKKEKNSSKYYTYNFNDGVTIIELWYIKTLKKHFKIYYICDKITSE